jgi:aromatic ring-opening dioxygenase catalytic subunit (LigB family)
MFDLENHEGFRASHPTAEHFVPIYVAGGAGEDGQTKVVAAIHGALTVAFGL